MPILSGIDAVMRCIRSEFKDRTPVIIAVTADVFEETRQTVVARI